MQESLEKRFLRFAAALPDAEALDDVTSPDDRGEGVRIADFLVYGRRAILEVKHLQKDPAEKINAEINEHRSREEFPVFYGQWELEAVLKHLPDGESIKRRIYERITRSTEAAFRSANRQIASTREVYGLPESPGILVLLNEDIAVLSPEVLAACIQMRFQRKDPDGRYHYRDITHAWMISECHKLTGAQDVELVPSMVVDGPAARRSDEESRLLLDLQRAWARWNGVPLVVTSNNAIESLAFEARSESGEGDNVRIPRHELWRRDYRDAPYLRNLSDEDVLRHGARLIEAASVLFRKDSKHGEFEKRIDLIKGWTHFLEEVNHRGLDLKRLRGFAEP